MSDLLNHKYKQLKAIVDENSADIKEIRKTISSQDTSIAKIEVIVEELKVKWSLLERDIRKAVGASQNESETAWKEVTLEAIKTIAYVAGAIVAAKIFL